MFNVVVVIGVIITVATGIPVILQEQAAIRAGW